MTFGGRFVTGMECNRKLSKYRWAVQTCAAAAGALLALFVLYFGVKIVIYDFYMNAAQSVRPDTEKLAYYEKAAQIQGDRATAWRQTADLLSFTDPVRALRDAQTAIGLDPYDWQNWKALGLIQFQLGEIDSSRRSFHRAVQVANGFEAHYALANFARLQGNTATFWRQIQAALRVAPAQDVPYALAAAISADQGSPVQHIIESLPANRQDVRVKAAAYLTKRNQLATAAKIWLGTNCPGYQRMDCADLTEHLSTKLLTFSFQNSGRPQAQLAADLAAQVWNHAVLQQVLPHPEAQVGKVADGSFSADWDGPAFSWFNPNGLPFSIDRDQYDTSHSVVTYTFDGQQLEGFALFQQLVPVQPGHQYMLQYHSKGDGSRTQAGIGLRVQIGPPLPAIEIPAHLGSDWNTNSATIQIPPNTFVVDLMFHYQRPYGHTLLRGTIHLADVTMQDLGEQP